MNTPDWKDAPEWAQFLAMDRDGLWYWYEAGPAWIAATGAWMCIERHLYAGITQAEKTLQERPK